MTGIIRLSFQVILGVNDTRIWTPPTQFWKLKKYFKIQFPGNFAKILIPPNQHNSLSQFQSFKIKKNRPRNKVMAICNSGIHPIYERWKKFWTITKYLHRFALAQSLWVPKNFSQKIKNPNWWNSSTWFRTLFGISKLTDASFFVF